MLTNTAATAIKNSWDAYSDNEAVVAFVGGDQRAFRHLYNKHYKYVNDYVCKKLNFNKELAREITSQTFVNFYRYAGNFKVEFNVKVSSFLCEIANNLIIDNYRKSRRSVEFNSFSLSDDALDVEHLMLDKCSLSSPEYLLDRKMKYTILYNHLNRLDPLSYQIVLYFYKEELSYQEICTRLDLPLHLVKTKLFRAKKKLKSYLLNTEIR